MTEDEMVGWHHQVKGHESEQAPGDGEGHGSLACCSPWDHKELDTTEATQQQQQQLFTSGGQSIGASASASVLAMNIQD